MRQAVGGQAVVEGVMMRTPSAWAVAVRRPDGRITTVVEDARSVALRSPLRLPIICQNRVLSVSIWMFFLRSKLVNKSAKDVRIFRSFARQICRKGNSTQSRFRF